MRNNKIYILILIVLITISGVSFIIYKSTINKNTSEILKNSSKKDIVKKTLSSDTNIVSKEIKQDIQNDELLFDKTIKKYSTNIDFLKCKNIDKLDDYSCINNIINSKIGTTKDSSFCDEMNGIYEISICKDMNSSSFAIKENNIQLCETINDVAIKNNCKLDLTINEVILKKDISKCDILQDDVIKNNCKDTTIFRLASITKDKSWCEKLENSRQNICIESINNNN